MSVEKSVLKQIILTEIAKTVDGLKDRAVVEAAETKKACEELGKIHKQLAILGEPPPEDSEWDDKPYYDTRTLDEVKAIVLGRVRELENVNNAALGMITAYDNAIHMCEKAFKTEQLNEARKLREQEEEQERELQLAFDEISEDLEDAADPG